MSGRGAERQLVLLTGELMRRGWDVHVALIRGGPNYEALAATGCRIHKIFAINNYDITILPQLVALIARIRPHLVHTWMLQMDVLGGVASKLTGRPFIVSERCSESTYQSGIKNYLRVCVGRFAAAVISNSIGGKKYWQEMTGSGVPTYIVRNLLPLSEIENTGPTVCEIDIESTAKVLLFAGRFSPEKNIETIIDAFEIVSSQKDAVLLLCGEGELKPKIEEMVREKDLAARVFFLGYVQNVWEFMKRADLFISVSYYEGRPNVVLEAIACGCPLILSDIPAHRDFLLDGDALFVNPRDASALAGAIVKALEDPEMSRKMAVKAKKEVSSYSVSNTTDQYEDIYQTVLLNH